MFVSTHSPQCTRSGYQHQFSPQLCWRILAKGARTAAVNCCSSAKDGCRNCPQTAFHVLRRQLCHHEADIDGRINDHGHDTLMERSSRDNRKPPRASSLRQTVAAETTNPARSRCRLQMASGAFRHTPFAYPPNMPSSSSTFSTQKAMAFPSTSSAAPNITTCNTSTSSTSKTLRT